MRLISASRRTDLPAFHARWLHERFTAGFCEVRNPFNSKQISRVTLDAASTLGVVFWSRSPRPAARTFEWLEERGTPFVLQFTINGYPRSIETHNPPVASAISQLRDFADRYGPERVHWRYDPVVISSVTDALWHRENFASLARELGGSTTRVTVSFVDLYGKTKRNLGKVEREHGIDFTGPGRESLLELSTELAEVAKANAITARSCCDDGLGDSTGFQRGRCVDPDDFDGVELRAKPTRDECGCVRSVDIGAYDTCLFGCTYCYATNSREAAERRMAGMGEGVVRL